MNAFTQSCDPSPDMEEVWKRSLIRVTDEFTLPPVVLRVDDAIIGTLGNFSVSTGKAKAKKTFNVCALVAAALINGQVLEYQASFPETKCNILYFDTEQSPYRDHCASPPPYSFHPLASKIGVFRLRSGMPVSRPCPLSGG